MKPARLIGPVAACLVLTFASWAAAQRPGGPAPVVAAPVIEKSLAAEQGFVGSVRPRRMSIVGSAVEGRVVDYLVNEGDRVVKDQPLAQIRTGTLEIELAAAKAELEVRRQELAELKNGTRPEEIEQAKARMLSTEAALKYTQTRHERNDSLFRRGQAITEDEMQKSISTLLAAQHLHREAKLAHDLAVKGPRQEKIDRAAAFVAVQEENVKHIEDRLEKHTVRAPFDGYVVREATEVGQWILQGDPVAEVAELDVVEIEIYVPEAYIAYLHNDLAANVKLDSLGGKIFSGRIARIVPQADPRSRTFPVKVEVANPLAGGLPELKGGMLARVGLPIAAQQNAILVPKDALVFDGPSPTLRVIAAAAPDAKQGTVRSVPVQTGVADGAWIQVRGDVRPGQRVVVKGNERVFPGTAVEIVQEIAAN